MLLFDCYVSKEEHHFCPANLMKPRKRQKNKYQVRTYLQESLNKRRGIMQFVHQDLMSTMRKDLLSTNRGMLQLKKMNLKNAPL